MVGESEHSHLCYGCVVGLSFLSAFFLLRERERAGRSERSETEQERASASRTEQERARASLNLDFKVLSLAFKVYKHKSGKD